MKFSTSKSGLFALVLAFAFTTATEDSNVDKGVIINGCTTTYPNKRDISATATVSGHEADYTNPKSCEVFAALLKLEFRAYSSVLVSWLGFGVLSKVFEFEFSSGYGGNGWC
jgi:hypothetical protein